MFFYFLIPSLSHFFSLFSLAFSLSYFSRSHSLTLSTSHLPTLSVSQSFTLSISSHQAFLFGIRVRYSNTKRGNNQQTIHELRSGVSPIEAIARCCRAGCLKCFHVFDIHMRAATSDRSCSLSAWKLICFACRVTCGACHELV